MLLLAEMYTINIVLPQSNLLAALFLILGAYVLVRLAARFIEILPG